MKGPGSHEYAPAPVALTGSAVGRPDPQPSGHRLADMGLAAWSLPEAILLTDSGGVVLAANPAALRLFDAQEAHLLGQSFGGLFTEPRTFTEALSHLRDGVWSSEVELRRGADPFSASLSAGPAPRVERGEPCLSWLVRDLSEERRTQGELLRQDRLASIGRLAAGTAHELNNPLSGIFGFAQLLQEETMSEESQRYLQWIIDEARRCQRIVANLLLFGQAHGARKRPVPVQRVVTDAYALGDYQWRLGHVEFTFSLPQGPLVIQADPHLMQQVVFNILRNAVDAMPEGGSVRVEVAAIPPGDSPLKVESVLLSIADSGQGIPEDVLDKVFDPFFTTREIGQGSGLGLSIVYGIVREHGGEIRVDSVPWKGTTFRIFLPRWAGRGDSPDEG